MEEKYSVSFQLLKYQLGPNTWDKSKIGNYTRQINLYCEESMMSESDFDCEIVDNEETTVREIFKCIARVEAEIDGIDYTLWKAPQNFYDFLVNLNASSEKPKDLWSLWTNLQTDGNLTAIQLMSQIFETPWPHDTQPMLEADLNSRTSWSTFEELASANECFSMSYPLELVITSLELLKEIRIKNVVKMRQLKKKQSGGLDAFVKKSKIQTGTAAGKDPSLPYTSTSSRVMNTFTSSTIVPSEDPNVNVLSWLEFQSEGDNQSIFAHQPHLESNSGGLSQDITFHAQKEGEITSSYTWPVEECSTYLTMTIHPWKNAKNLQQKDVWTARTQHYKICIGKNNLKMAQALQMLTTEAIRQTDPKVNADVQCQRTTKKRAFRPY